MKNNNIDAFEEEVESLETEEKEVAEKAAAPKRKAAEAEAPTEKYIAVHQVEIIGIVDTITGEWVIQGLPSIIQAELEALKLNKLDKIETSTGINN